MKDAGELRHLLAHHTGTTQWYRHPFSRCTYTDGVKAFAQNAGHGAYWLLDIVLTQPEIVQGMRDEGLVFVWLNVTEDKKATLRVARDSGNEPTLYARDIDYTDCPPGEWVFNFTQDVLMIPSEY